MFCCEDVWAHSSGYESSAIARLRGISRDPGERVKNDACDPGPGSTPNR